MWRPWFDDGNLKRPHNRHPFGLLPFALKEDFAPNSDLGEPWTDPFGQDGGDPCVKVPKVVTRSTANVQYGLLPPAPILGRLAAKRRLLTPPGLAPPTLTFDTTFHFPWILWESLWWSRPRRASPQKLTASTPTTTAPVASKIAVVLPRCGMDSNGCDKRFNEVLCSPGIRSQLVTCSVG